MSLITRPATRLINMKKFNFNGKFQKKAVKKRKRRKNNGEHVFIGFDSEYVKRQRQTVNDKGEPTTEDYNFVLTYQMFGLCGERTWEVYEVVDNNRLTLKEVIKRTIEAGMATGALKCRPDQVFLCAHFSRADITLLADFREVKTHLDCCRNTITTLAEPVEVTYSDQHNNAHKVVVYVRDTWLLLPEGKRGAETMGQLIGVPKVDIGDYDKARMDILLAEDPVLFRRYAMADSEITARYLQRVTKLVDELWRRKSPPVTIGGCAVDLVNSVWDKAKIDALGILGNMIVEEDGYRNIVPVENRFYYDPLASGCFAGGRNEAFYYGIAPSARYNDIDLKGAYSMGLACLGTPDWDSLHATTDLNQFTLDVMGCGKVRFKFPDGTRFPCLPVRHKTGLIFPMEGESYTTSPELDLARRMGAEIEVLHGCVMKVDMRVRPFLTVTTDVTKLREGYKKQHGKGSMMELFIKTVGNSVYGKIAQSVRPKRAYNMRHNQMQTIGPSKITNPHIAYYVTGLIRALLGEILWAVPEGSRVLSVTTDGFLTDYPADRLSELCRGPLARLFADARELAAGERGILEVKHEAERVIVWRTRGTVSVDDGSEDEGRALILARGGIKRDHTCDVPAECEKLVGRFVNRVYGEATEWTKLRGVRDICETGLDMTDIKQATRYTMDYDFKRLPVNETELPIEHGGEVHQRLAFDTKPLRNVDEFDQLRDKWADFYDRFQRPMKTREDFAEFVEFTGVHEVGKLKFARKKANTAVADPAVHTARKMFLIAYKRGLWGLEPVLSNQQLAERLTSLGYATTVEECENARRQTATLYPHCVEKTPNVRRFLDCVGDFFLGFDPTELLAPATSPLLLRQQNP